VSAKKSYLYTKRVPGVGLGVRREGRLGSFFQSLTKSDQPG